MDWTPGGLSDDVEDRRGSSGGGGFGGGGLGIVGFIVLIVISLVTGRNYIGSYLAGGGTVPSHASQPMAAPGDRPYSGKPGEDLPAELVSWTLGDVQQTWATLLPEQTGREYRKAKLVLYDNYTYSGCGTAQSQTGPFYCPADEKVYIDLSFWNELRRLGGSNAEFAQAYVVAHELGHHVQNILGIEQRVRHLSGQDPSQRNPLSVDLELQADCLAGVWAHGTEQRNHRSRCRHRGGFTGRGGCRRRSPATNGAGNGESGEFYPWLFCAAHWLVQTRPGAGHHCSLQYLSGTRCSALI